MGRVLRAWDPELQRVVALKEVRRDALDAEMTRRLLAEARAMAELSHPNVVAIYDVQQLDEGEVVLVMEYVAGTTLARWLLEARADWRTTIDRFVEAGRGLAAAHAVGLLHRDFKPSNVLVGEHGGVKVTDFGLAKRVTSSDSPSTRPSIATPDETRTQPGSAVGTPRYMAPEQHGGAELTAAADQYAFCLALWEALCGTSPFPRVGRETAKRRGPPAWTGTGVPVAIVNAMRRGLAPDPRDRWPSMDDLLRALTRDRCVYRAAALCVLGVVGLAAAAAGATQENMRCSGADEQLAGVWDASRRSTIEAAMLGTGKPHADEAWSRTRDEIDAWAESWTAMHRETCEAAETTEAMDLQMACLHRAKLGLRAAADVLADADAEAVTNAHRIAGGLPELDRCADVDALRSGVEAPRSRDAVAVAAARALLAQAEAELDAGWYTQARATLAAAQEVMRDADYEPLRIELAVSEGIVLERLGEFAASEASLVHAFESATQRGDSEQTQKAAALLLAVVGLRLQRPDEALRRYAKPATALSASDVPARAAAERNLGAVLYAQGEYEAAETAQRSALALDEQAFGPEHPYVANARGNLAIVLATRGRLAEAEVEHRRALAVREAALGPDHPDVAVSYTNLGEVLRVSGRYQEAEAAIRRALSIAERSLGTEHLHVAGVRNNLAIILTIAEQYEAAEAELRRVLALREQLLGADHPEVARSRNNLAIVLVRQGRHAEAEVEHRRALEDRVRTLGPDHVDVAESRSNLANVLSALGRHDEAEAEYRTALSLRERALGSDHAEVAVTRYNLASLLRARGRAADALELAERAWLDSEHDDVPPDQRSDAQFLLARVLWDTGRSRARALELAERAADGYTRSGPAWRDAAREVEQWIDERRG